MALEIELKARLDTVELVEKQLSALGNYYHTYKKSDSYWFPVQNSGQQSVPASGVRVRRENSVDASGSVRESTLVTCKHKEIFDSIEINNEDEFSVSNADLFEALLERLCLRKGICKEKQGRAWIIPAAGQPHILAEVSQVKGLGWFLEIEILTASDAEKTVAESRQRLLDLLKKLEIPEERIEARPYTVMLQEKG